MNSKPHPDFPEVLFVYESIYHDSRGYFFEAYRNNWWIGNVSFVQDNISCSVRNVVRGLHFQVGRPQAKLVRVLTGLIRDVVVDIRPSSPTFGERIIVPLSEGGPALFIPAGFAHGFAALDESVVLYKCSDEYVPSLSRGILWCDPDLGIDWGVTEQNAIVSDKDRNNPLLKDADLKGEV